jgi:hypothetical protein
MDFQKMGEKMAIEKIYICMHVYKYISVCVKPYLKIFQEIDPFPKFPARLGVP